MYELSFIYMSFNWCQTNRRGSSEFVLHTGNSLAGNPCVFANACLSFMYLVVYSLFQVQESFNQSLMFTSSFHIIYFQVLGKKPLKM